MKIGGHEIDEGAEVARKAARGEDEVNDGGARFPFRQDRDKLAARNLAACHPFGHHGHASAGDGGFAQGDHAVHDQHGREWHQFFLHAATKFYAVAREEVRLQNAHPRELREVGGIFGGAMLLQKRRGREEVQFHAGDVAQRDGGIGDFASKNAAVETFRDEFTGAVGEVKLGGDVGMEFAKGGEQAGNNPDARVENGDDAKVSARAGGFAANAVGGIGREVENFAGVIQQAMAGRGEAQGMGVAAHEDNAGGFFELAKLPAHSGLGHVQAARGGADAAALGNAHEHTKKPEIVQSGHAKSV